MPFVVVRERRVLAAHQTTQVPPRHSGRLASPIGLRMRKTFSRKTMLLLKGGVLPW